MVKTMNVPSSKFSKVNENPPPPRSYLSFVLVKRIFKRYPHDRQNRDKNQK